MSDKATARPWHVYTAPDGCPYVKSTYKDEKGRRCHAFLAACNCGGQDNQANAELIVKAVNNYDTLLSLAEEMAGALVAVTKDTSSPSALLSAGLALSNFQKWKDEQDG